MLGPTYVTVRRVTTTEDADGDATTATSSATWGPCLVAPRYSSESADTRAPRVVVGKVIYGPAIDLDSDDEVVVDGETWLVDGLPGVWPWPLGGTAGVEVNLKRGRAV